MVTRKTKNVDFSSWTSAFNCTISKHKVTARNGDLCRFSISKCTKKALFTTKTDQANRSYYRLNVYVTNHVDEILVQAKAYIEPLSIFLFILDGLLMHSIPLKGGPEVLTRFV